MILLGISQCLLWKQFSASLLELEADGLLNKGHKERRESFVCFTLISIGGAGDTFGVNKVRKRFTPTA